jgi:hypothetical protein
MPLHYNPVSLMHRIESDFDLSHVIKMGDKLFGKCRELLTAHGNLTLRKTKDQCTNSTFKGVRNMALFQGLVQTVLYPVYEAGVVQPSVSACVHMVSQAYAGSVI